MIGHKIRFKGVMWKIVLKLSLSPLLIWSTAVDEETQINRVCLIYLMLTKTFPLPFFFFFFPSSSFAFMTFSLHL